MDLPTRLLPYQEPLAELCREYGVAELAAFGSILRDDSGTDSDVDLLVEFLPGVRVGLFHLIRLQLEFQKLFDRRVDLVPQDGLKPLIRDSVLQSSKRIYAA